MFNNAHNAHNTHEDNNVSQIIASFTFNDYNNGTRYAASVTDGGVCVRIDGDTLNIETRTFHVDGRTLTAYDFNDFNNVAWIEYIEQMFDEYTKDEDGNVVRRDTLEG